jgi:DNA-binding winged helix-turn-helix (wHTH) protein
LASFTVDSDQRVLLRNGSLVPLAQGVFDTLLILIENGGRIVKKEELMSKLWRDTLVEEANLTWRSSFTRGRKAATAN